MATREEEIIELIGKNPMISQKELAAILGITRSSVAVHISNLMKKGRIAGKGYVIKEKPYILVIGGIARDIGGSPYKTLIPRDSNIGKVTYTYGGVGRNIAHNLALLGQDVKMLSAIAAVDDEAISQYCRSVGIDISHVKRVNDGTTATYMYITDENRDMAVAIADTEIFSHINVDYLKSKKNIIDGAVALVIDANLDEETLDWITTNYKGAIFSDPISTEKAVKLKKCLSNITLLKPNKLEAEKLSEVEIRDEQSFKEAIVKLMDTGLKQICVSQGEKGMLGCYRREDGELVFHFEPAIKVEMKNATGGGDAFMAGMVYSFIKGYSFEEACHIASTVGAMAVESKDTVNEKISEEAILSRISDM